MRTLNDHLKERFGGKVYKLALSSGCSCPNWASGGCIFCDGAGAFAARGPIGEQLREAKARVSAKGATQFIAYFQSFTNTFGAAEELEVLFREAMAGEDVVGLSIATRPDCLGEDILAMLGRLSKEKPLWVELGLQTIHPESAAWMRRGYDLPVFDRAVAQLHGVGAEVVVHQILGLPGETAEDMAATARYIRDVGAEGVKFHLLHVLRGTDLEREYREGRVEVLTLEAYIQCLIQCVQAVGEDVVIHRLTGDGAKRDLIAPLWSADKKRVLNEIHRRLREAGVE